MYSGSPSSSTSKALSRTLRVATSSVSRTQSRSLPNGASFPRLVHICSSKKNFRRTTNRSCKCYPPSTSSDTFSTTISPSKSKTLQTASSGDPCSLGTLSWPNCELKPRKYSKLAISFKNQLININGYQSNFKRTFLANMLDLSI